MSEQISDKDLPLAKKVEVALKKLAADKRLKRSKLGFAKLVGVSRGTLYNHGWPMTRYEEFCVEEKKNKVKPPRRPSDTTHEFDLVKSDTEILGWKRKCDALKAENEGLKKRLEDLREQLRMRVAPHAGGNVVRLPSASSDDRDTSCRPENVLPGTT